MSDIWGHWIRYGKRLRRKMEGNFALKAVFENLLGFNSKGKKRCGYNSCGKKIISKSFKKNSERNEKRLLKCKM